MPALTNSDYVHMCLTASISVPAIIQMKPSLALARDRCVSNAHVSYGQARMYVSRSMPRSWFVASMLVLHFEALRGCAATSDTPFTGRICPPVGPLASLTWALPANLLILASTALEQGLLAVLASDRRCVMTCLKFDGSFAAMCE